MSEKIKILYIDDEENNLLAFKASFRMDYNILLARDTIEADKHLAANSDIEIVISDQRMPGITGAEFFEKIRTEYPQPVRMLITGYTDIESVINAVNKGNIFRYIRKPWNEAEIKTAIEEGHKFFVATYMLDQKSKEVERAYKELDRFSYSVAHELKGPLVSITESLKMIAEEPEPEKNKLLIDLAEKSTTKLLSFVQSMFDYYRLKQGELDITDIDFDSIIRDYSDMYSISGALKNITFESSYTTDGSVFRSDESKLRVIINNLLSNSFKYHKREDADRWVKLEIMVTAGTAKIMVSDNGIGIKDMYINNIFDMFYRATTQEPGSGFGLFNVKDAISKLNGNIDVESVPDKGSTFMIVIPTK